MKRAKEERKKQRDEKIKRNQIRKRRYEREEQRNKDVKVPMDCCFLFFILHWSGTDEGLFAAVNRHSID